MLSEHEFSGDATTISGTPIGVRSVSLAANRAEPLPSFFVVGPPRTGSSWLHEVLRERTLLPSPTKETRFFDLHFHRGVKWYRSHYPKSGEGQLLMGEVAPTYFAASEARERIASVVPGARVVCVFRNPVERVLSLYRIKRAYGMVPWSFEQAVTRDPELTETGKYATHLKGWQRALGKDQVLAAIYDDLRDSPQDFIDGLADFIGLPRFRLTSSQLSYVHASEKMTQPRSYFRTRSATALAEWCKARRLDRVVSAVKQSGLIRLFLGGGPPFDEVPPEMSADLYNLFRPEVAELEDLLDRDLSAWKSAAAKSKQKQAIG